MRRSPRQPSAKRSVGPTGRRGASRAFTLVELIVVIGIIGVLTAISLPNIAAMWQDAARADAENRIRGLLRSARMRALNNKETGLFFFVSDGIQRIAFIEADPVNRSPDDASIAIDDGVSEQDVADRFHVLQEVVQQLKVPFRVAPLTVFHKRNGLGYRWSDEEIANNDYRTSAPGAAGVEYHRNFFTMIFSTDGKLLVDQPVLIRDAPTDADPGAEYPQPGRFTGLTIDRAGEYAEWREWNWGDDDVPFNGSSLRDMIVRSSGGVALNFPSVDGLMVYDDELLRDVPDSDQGSPTIEDKREFLLRTGRPYYVSRQTGTIIAGPLAEPEGAS